MQDTPCRFLLDVSTTERGEFALTPFGFANFYHAIFEYWFNELKNGNYISIKLFDDIVNYLLIDKLPPVEWWEIVPFSM